MRVFINRGAALSSAPFPPPLLLARRCSLMPCLSLARFFSLSLALLLGDRQKSIVNRKSACPSVVCLCIALTRLQSTALQQRLPRLRVSDAASNSSLHFCLSTFAVFIDFSRVLLGILRRLLQRTHRIGGGSRQPRQQQRQSSRSAAALS